LLSCTDLFAFYSPSKQFNYLQINYLSEIRLSCAQIQLNISLAFSAIF